MNTQTNLISEELEQTNLHTGEKLLPADIEERQEREEGAFTEQPEVDVTEDFNKTSGYRVSEQGLINNDPMRRNYTMIGIVGASIVAVLLGVTTLVNMVNMTL